MTTPAEHWRHLLRGELLTARKQRDTVRVAALRSALAAVDNAETPESTVVSAQPGRPGTPTGTVAGSVQGLGAAEVARRVLSDEQIRSLLTAEVDERVGAAATADAGGFPDRAATLRGEAEVLEALLGNV